MIKMKLLVVLVLSLFYATTLVAQNLIFGVYTSDKASVMYKKFKPIIDYLEKDSRNYGMDIKIVLKIYPTYQDALNGFIKGEYDFARFGPASYILAKEKNNKIRLLAMENNKGQKSFKGVFIARADSTINNINDLTNKKFAFGDSQSTIGRYLAQAEMIKAGINSKSLKEFDYLGRHDKVALAVVNGDYDAGVVKQSTFKKYKDRGLKIISEFDNISKPWVASGELDAKYFNMLKKSLLNLKDKEVLKVIKKDGFFEAKDSDYNLIRDGIIVSKDF